MNPLDKTYDLHDNTYDLHDKTHDLHDTTHDLHDKTNQMAPDTSYLYLTPCLCCDSQKNRMGEGARMGEWENSWDSSGSLIKASAASSFGLIYGFLEAVDLMNFATLSSLAGKQVLVAEAGGYDKRLEMIA